MMIPVSFWLWVGIIIFFFFGLFLWLWILFPPDREISQIRDKRDQAKVVRCPYCGAVVEDPHQEVVKCPVCKSYF